MSNTVYNFSVNKITGEQINLSAYEGKVMLIVNVASECGLTPQYEALEKVYKKYAEKGLVVLGFPANEFGAQEPGTNSQIQEFCTSKFGIQFPMFEKIVVKGAGQNPLYKFLTTEKPTAQLNDGPSFEEKLKGYGITRENPSDILWNFEKFLIGRDGKVLARFSPDITPEDALITKAIEAAL